MANYDGPISLVTLHKVMFLFQKASDKRHYSFIPNKFGCYSLTLHDDQVALIKKKFLIEEKGNSPFESNISINRSLLDTVSIPLKKEDSRILDKVILAYQMKTEQELIDLTYRMEPIYGIRSMILDRFPPDDPFLVTVASIKEEIAQTPRALYTIGYEGLSIDGFIQELLVRNITCLVDVRKNAFSMRREFCKKNLEEALGEAGIRYISMPDVGIPSNNRKELLHAGKKIELFAWYQKKILPKCTTHSDEIADLLRAENVVLMCYEKNPADCHRSLFAAFCKEQQPSIPSILHIRGDSGEEKNLDNRSYLSNAFSQIH
ncbi:DUF488 domain-containing protein [Sphaerochaeta sp. PS]|uniref:DUF488 domain-containing protein n=1 Tax=Sphaerochaeta sp. PS TaxID=3076336 RepID=UPI0028A56D65|nr:DUF488 domain-containing protein [Sphaerochaeta sp. PS]MDT4763235.1 DUF488 domain-containing protein [Sphaerochaeta sp. PS]